MPRQGGLGRGLASLIPQKKQDQDPITHVNYFGSPSEEEKVFVPAEEQKVMAEGAEEQGRKEDTQAGIAAESAPTAPLASGAVELPVDLIVANPFQPRKHFDEVKLQELADSIKIHGIIQPLVVSRKDHGQYELIAGERRLEGCKLAGVTTVPAIIKEVSDQQKLELALIENIQRHDLDVIEEARSYKQLQDMFSLTQEEISQRVGKSRPSVANIMRLLNLPIEIQKALQSGRINEGHARTILAISNPEKQRALFELILKEHLTVRQVEDKVKEISVGSHNRKVKSIDPEIKEKEDQLASVLGTKVKIKSTTSGGQVVIEYFSPEELSGLIDRLTIREDQ